MHATLSELLENLQTGMLWLSRDGLVRFANTQAVAKLRLNAGSRVQEPTLVNAVSGTVREQSARVVTIAGHPASPGAPVPELRCKVLPGLSRDDAMVLVADGADEQADVGFDNLMQVIRSDLRDPLSLLTQSLVVARNDRDVHALDALCDQVEEQFYAITPQTGGFLTATLPRMNATFDSVLWFATSCGASQINATNCNDAFDDAKHPFHRRVLTPVQQMTDRPHRSQPKT